MGKKISFPLCSQPNTVAGSKFFFEFEANIELLQFMGLNFCLFIALELKPIVEQLGVVKMKNRCMQCKSWKDFSTKFCNQMKNIWQIGFTKYKLLLMQILNKF